MSREPVISCGCRKRSVAIVAGLALTGVILTCIVFPKIVFAGRSIISLQMTIDADTPEKPVIPEQQALHDTSQEQQLIASLMQDVVVSAAHEPKTKEGWQSVRMRVTGYCPCSQCCGSFSDGITANNHRIRLGDTFVAADKSYQFGTEMVIPGYSSDRSVQVMDRGGAI
ncbi:MAG: RlpA-like double-psi beta-barrel domain-containing protein, partial [Planctomycetota bacterium]